MSKAIREAYGEALAEFGGKNENVVVLDADVSGSTKSAMFAKVAPERFFNVGIAEANMAAMAGGLASVGKIPFINSFAVFLTSNSLCSLRSLASYSELPIKIAGAYAGMSDAFDGPSHHALEDIAVMRTLPNVEVYAPCDERQTKWLVKYAIETPKPMYLRLSRDVFPDIYEEGTEFAPGKGSIVREGKDATVMACGLMVGNAIKAADILEEQGISLRVVDMFSIKPIDRSLIIKCAAETGAIISAEEHSIYGGLGGAVAEVLAEANCKVPMGFVGVNDMHGECGPYKKLQEKYGFDANTVVDKVLETLKRK